MSLRPFQILAQRLLRAEILRNFWTLVNLKVCFPFLKDPAKSKGREKGGRYKVLIVPAEFPSWFFFHFIIQKEYCFTSSLLYNREENLDP